MMFTLCPECGNCLGEIITAYKMISMFNRLEQSKKKNIVCPDKEILMEGNFEPEEDILDALGLENYCCRTKILTSREFHDILTSSYVSEENLSSTL
jgi:DNA-directed RNA polymerase subunit N (RpoN/RPB10)